MTNRSQSTPENLLPRFLRIEATCGSAARAVATRGRVPAIAVLMLALAVSAPSVAQAASPVSGATASGMRAAQEAVRRDSGARVMVDPATGAARSMRFGAGRGPKAPAGASAPASADAFVSRHAAAFGIADAARELAPESARVDDLGMTHRRYRQQVDGVEVYGGVLDVHVGRGGEVRSANARIVPGIAVDTRARVSAERAGRIAVDAVLSEPPGSEEKGGGTPVGPALEASSTKLWVYDDGLVRGRRGAAHLAWLVEVRGPGVREFVFVDAHAGKVLERWSGVHDGMSRRLYQGSTSTQVWAEGDPFPGALNADQQNILVASEDAYRLFANAFGRDSWDGAGAEMRSINDDPSISCPNANWDGSTTNYCTGVTADDVVAHEWAHAYTERTSDLIYLWQAGALNESYSDIWGETVDQLNGYGTDAPAAKRSDDLCTSYLSGSAPADVVVASPAGIAGTYLGGTASFGPRLDTTGVSGVLVLAADAVPATSDACEALANGAQMAGRVALVDRGTCTFAAKVKNAQNAGAIAVIVADDDPTAPAGAGMSGTDATITIPSIRVPKSTGDLLRGALASSPVVTLRADPRENSVRWLMGEDADGFGGAIRDLWNPNCAGDPARVGDARYYCGSGDGGGVHTNSGVPNHGFALLVDGGTFEGHVVPAIGLVKAAHVHWRAQSVYLQPASEFPDHADALEAACDDLLGIPLAGLGTDAIPPGPSGQAITQADCDAVAAMTAALDLRADIQDVCNFEPLLAADPPARCADNGATPLEVWSEGFESGAAGWTTASTGVFAGWPGTTWSVSSDLPDGRAGKAAFGPDPRGGSCDGGARDASGVTTWTSPPITIPGWLLMAPRLEFDHYVATESGWDGGNLKVALNGGAFALVPSAAFRFNAYNSSLRTATGSPANTNPLAGQSAFTGTDGGSLGGSWGRSQIDLSAVGVKPGDVVRLRFDMGMDGCTGNDGWYVDDLAIYACDSVGQDAVSIDLAVLAPASAGRASAKVIARIATGTSAADAIEPGTDWLFDLVDGSGAVSETVSLLASRCTASPGGNRITCKSEDRSTTALFVASTKQPGEWKLTLNMKKRTFASSPTAAVRLVVSRSSRAWTGSISTCLANSSGKLSCKP